MCKEQHQGPIPVYRTIGQQIYRPSKTCDLIANYKLRVIMNVEKITVDFNSKKIAHNIAFEPKFEQMLIASHINNGRNTLGLLPTGFG